MVILICLSYKLMMVNIFSCAYLLFLHSLRRNVCPTDIFLMLSLLIQKHSISLHLLRLFDSFLQCLVVFSSQILPVFVRCIPKYYIFVAIKNDIVLLILVSTCTLLAYIIDLSVLALYLAALLSSLISSSRFLFFFFVDLLIFSMQKIIHISVKRVLFLAFQSVYIPFLSYIIALARMSSMIKLLNSSGEIEQPYFVPNTRRKAFSFSPIIMLLVVLYRCSLLGRGISLLFLVC